jgi:hypothetical protein
MSSSRPQPPPSVALAETRARATACRMRDLPTRSQSPSTALALRFEARPDAGSGREVAGAVVRPVEEPAIACVASRKRARQHVRRVAAAKAVTRSTPSRRDPRHSDVADPLVGSRPYQRRKRSRESSGAASSCPMDRRR